MAGFPSPFRSRDEDGLFDPFDEFVPAHIPDPPEFLAGHEVLTGMEHVAFHRLTAALFEERRVYDMTFNYNLARLNLDTRHPSAGYRYAREADDSSVLRAAFTPTTPFCPQAQTLAVGSSRAWNGLSDRHEYDLVRVRVAPMHHQSETINARLESLETTALDDAGDAAVETTGQPADEMAEKVADEAAAEGAGKVADDLVEEGAEEPAQSSVESRGGWICETQGAGPSSTTNDSPGKPDSPF